VLRNKPLRELEKLRHEEKRQAGVPLKSSAPHLLAGWGGDALELDITFEPGTARAFGVEVLADATGKNGFPITIEPAAATLRLGTMAVPFDLKPGAREWLASCVVLVSVTRIDVTTADEPAPVSATEFDTLHTR